MRTQIATATIPNPFLHYRSYLYSHGHQRLRLVNTDVQGEGDEATVLPSTSPPKVLEWGEVISSEKKLKCSVEGVVYTAFSTHWPFCYFFKDRSIPQRARGNLAFSSPNVALKTASLPSTGCPPLLNKRGLLLYLVLLANDLFFLLSRVPRNLY